MLSIGLQRTGSVSGDKSEARIVSCPLGVGGLGRGNGPDEGPPPIPDYLVSRHRQNAL